MTVKIYKYPLQLVGRQVIKISEGHHILAAQLQGENICLWAEVCTDQPLVEVPIFIVGTGQEVPFDACGYLATVQKDGFVWHIYE